MIYLFYCVLSLLYFLPCSTPAKVEVASAIQQPISSSSSSLPASISPSRSACNSSSLPSSSRAICSSRSVLGTTIECGKILDKAADVKDIAHIVPPDLHHVTMDHNNAAADSVLLLFFPRSKPTKSLC